MSETFREKVGVIFSYWFAFCLLILVAAAVMAKISSADLYIAVAKVLAELADWKICFLQFAASAFIVGVLSMFAPSTPSRKAVVQLYARETASFALNFSCIFLVSSIVNCAVSAGQYGPWSTEVALASIGFLMAALNFVLASWAWRQA